MGNPNIWVESLWLTHRESVTIEDPVTKQTITRDLSVGMTLKSDKSATSEYMYRNLKAALNRIVEEEKEEWLDSHLMKSEAKRLERTISAGGEDGPGTENKGPVDSPAAGNAQ